MSDPYARIFLLSHMRAYTSLAGHILGSNPGINGYYEMHISYEGAADLQRQLADYRKHDPLKAGSRFLFDKLLHNDYRLTPGGLGPVSLHLLVALRRPEATLKSIISLFAQKPSAAHYASPEAAARYYTERLAWLARFCATTDRDYRYFDAELWVEGPQRLLPTLTGWLGLEQPLQEHYQRFSQTGKARKGDSSPAIQRGEIVKQGRDYAEIRIPQAILAEAERAYADCRQRIIGQAADVLTR